MFSKYLYSSNQGRTVPKLSAPIPDPSTSCVNRTLVENDLQFQNQQSLRSHLPYHINFYYLDNIYIGHPHNPHFLCKVQGKHLEKS